MKSYKAWIDEKKALISNRFFKETLLKKFAEEIYVKKSIPITNEEQIKWEAMREEEQRDFRWRKLAFFPVWMAGIVGMDTAYVIPATNTNLQRGLVHLLIVMPLVSIFASGFVFKRANFESHDFALELC